MNWPTSSTKKFSRNVGSPCLSSQALTSSAKSSIETEYEALYCWMMPSAVAAVDLGEGAVDARPLQGALLASLGPRDAGDALEGLLERLVLAAVVEVALEAGDVALVAVVAPALVEDLDEHLEQGVGLVLGDQGGLLVDVEQQALGRDAVGLVEQAGQERVGGLGAEAVGDVLARVVLAFDVAEQVGKHLEHVRLTGAEEAGDPDAVGVGVVGVLLEQDLETLRGLVGQDVLVDLGAQVRGVIGLDDALDRTLDVLGEDLVELHRAHASCSRMFLAR